MLMQITRLDSPSSGFLALLAEELQRPVVVFFPYRFPATTRKKVPAHQQVDHQHWRMEIVKDGEFNVNVVLNYDAIANTEPLMVGYFRDLLCYHTVFTEQLTVIHQPAVSRPKTYGNFRSDRRNRCVYTAVTPINTAIAVAVANDQGVKDIDCAVGQTVLFHSDYDYAVELTTENCWYTHTVIRIDDLTCNQRGLELEFTDNTVADNARKKKTLKTT